MTTRTNALGRSVTQEERDRLLRRYRRGTARPWLYVAGPMLTHGNPYGNVHRAVRAGEIAFERGWQPILPQLNAFAEMAGTVRSTEEWMEFDFALIGRCNAVLFLHGSEHSRGAQEEASLLTSSDWFDSTAVYIGLEHLPTAEDWNSH